MSSDIENLISSTAPNRLGNPERNAGKYDRSLGIGIAWITALTFAWIATLFMSIATAWLYLP